METIPTSAGSVNGLLDEASTIGMDQTQVQLIEEQEAMIKTLNKQLAHCETDLQTHIDLVATLESSLNDSERNCKSFRNLLILKAETPSYSAKGSSTV